MSDKSLAIIPKSIDEVTSLAELLSKSSLIPDALKGKVPDVVFQILAGQELGLAPMASIRGVHIIQGKPVLSADIMVALILSSGLADYFVCVEETDTKVTYETKRKGAPIPQRATWTDDDTKAAGLNTKDNWRFYKRSMRKARAKAILARDVYPDVLAGVFAEEEDIGTPIRSEYKPPSVTEVVDAEIVSDVVDGNDIESRTFNALAAVEQAKSVGELKSDVLKCIAEMKLSGSHKDQVNDAYKARIKLLRDLEAKSPAVESAA